ncbi:MAG: WG repeat-containing protein [Bacteroidetes bacterium]|nr:MAG: WG repeat-containing protein [Bacteroidota bacterium]
MIKKLACLLVWLWFGSLLPTHAQKKNALFPMPNAQGKWGYVDANNKVIIPHKFHDASPFYEERAFVAIKQANGQVSCHAIDAKGTVLFEAKFLENQTDALYFSHYYHYSDGFLNVPQDENNTYKYIDKAGKLAFTFPHNCENYGISNNFSEGLAFVQLTDSTWGYIDTKGKLALQGKGFAPIEHNFHQGWAVISTDTGLTYLNKKGEKATFLAQYALQDLGEMREGYAFVALTPKDTLQQEPDYAILQPDYSLKPIALQLAHSTPVTYVSYYYFSNGLAFLCYYVGKDESMRERCGYLNTAGKIAFELPKELTPTRKGTEGEQDFYTAGGQFHEGLACWTIQYPNETKKIIYLNTQGKIVLQSPIFKTNR